MVENKKLETMNLDELQDLMIEIEAENKMLKEQILEKKEVIEDLISTVE